jgi:hypothetical protein
MTSQTKENIMATSRTTTKKEPYKPIILVKMTLKMETQSATLRQLNEVFGISESYPEIHEIICTHKLFNEYLFAVQKAGLSAELAKIYFEEVDIKKEPRRSVCRYTNMSYDSVHRLSK